MVCIFISGLLSLLINIFVVIFVFIGDFAILIKSGIAFRQAVAYNLASAFISFIGVIIGIAVGNLDTSHVWVLALTAGLFLYISLVSMVSCLLLYFAVFHCTLLCSLCIIIYRWLSW